ncbi:hypothetical protein [Vibrio paracholerae]|uniref:Uncharacterized protein n=3 Tax=Vibrionaceae TaxID=641 RepID=A0ABD7FY15_9VIBR|nr:hypothetical protein [Vibrio paracholerae]RBM71007.1 hypothetical protein DLR72_04590 [Vibrio paracholerae]
MKISIWFICFLAAGFIFIVLNRGDENGEQAQATQQSINTTAPENSELKADNIAPIIPKATISKPLSAANRSVSNAS